MIAFGALIFTSIYASLTSIFRRFLKKKQSEKEVKPKPKSVNELLDKYVEDEKKDLMKDKLSKISEIIAETERHIEKTVKQKVKVAEKQHKVQEKEFEVIKRANIEYVSFSAGLRSAMPTTEEEKKQDISDLQEAMSMLETLEEFSVDISNKKIDVGLGMFYDKMSRQFKKIINENNLSAYPFIPSERLKYHAFLNIKNIKNSDILPILSIMKETNLLNDIIEINPTFHLIIFTETPLEVTTPEKVVLTFAYDEESLNTEKLMELTEWKQPYAEKILGGLIDKAIVKMKDGRITVDSFGDPEERSKWRDIIHQQLLMEKEKEELRFQRYLDRRKKLQGTIKSQEKTEEAEIEEESLEEEPVKKISFEKKPTVKLPPKKKEDISVKIKRTKDEEAVKAEPARIIKEKDDLLSAMEALDEEKTEGVNSAQAIRNSSESDFELDFNLDEEERDLSDLIPEKVLNFHEDFSLINGGLVQYEKIKQYIQEQLAEITAEIPEDLLSAILEQLKELQMIQDLIKIGNSKFLLFSDVKLNFMHKRFIGFALDKKPLKKQDFIEGLRWNEEKVLNTMKELQEMGMMRIENNDIIIPGIIQK
ncbi:MAG: hypothetical protein JW891_00445 [Candidatus Lokiarchaeota archaeon]|nr:hypothetical protein [Candidatus Lokiarchaeota archaeon]